MENKYLINFREAIPKKLEIIMLYQRIYSKYQQIECLRINSSKHCKSKISTFLYAGKSVTEMYHELFCKECGSMMSFSVEEENIFYWEPVPI